jgi:hypothetical protein
LLEQAVDNFKEINIAHQVLKDPGLRNRYEHWCMARMRGMDVPHPIDAPDHVFFQNMPLDVDKTAPLSTTTPTSTKTNGRSRATAGAVTTSPKTQTQTATTKTMRGSINESNFTPVTPNTKNNTNGAYNKTKAMTTVQQPQQQQQRTPIRTIPPSTTSSSKAKVRSSTTSPVTTSSDLKAEILNSKLAGGTNCAKSVEDIPSYYSSLFQQQQPSVPFPYADPFSKFTITAAHHHRTPSSPDYPSFPICNPWGCIGTTTTTAPSSSSPPSSFCPTAVTGPNAGHPSAYGSFRGMFVSSPNGFCYNTVR